jgi:hypothetical protein
MGGRDEGWAARAFVLHDWVPVSMRHPQLLLLLLLLLLLPSNRLVAVAAIVGFTCSCVLCVVVGHATVST